MHSLMPWMAAWLAYKAKQPPRSRFAHMLLPLTVWILSELLSSTNLSHLGIVVVSLHVSRPVHQWKCPQAYDG